MTMGGLVDKPSSRPRGLTFERIKEFTGKDFGGISILRETQVPGKAGRERTSDKQANINSNC